MKLRRFLKGEEESVLKIMILFYCNFEKGKNSKLLKDSFCYYHFFYGGETLSIYSSLVIFEAPRFELFILLCVLIPVLSVSNVV